MSALLIFVKCSAICAQEAEPFSAELQALCARLSFLEALERRMPETEAARREGISLKEKTGHDRLYSVCRLETLRSRIAPDTPEEAWTYEGSFEETWNMEEDLEAAFEEASEADAAGDFGDASGEEPENARLQLHGVSMSALTEWVKRKDEESLEESEGEAPETAAGPLQAQIRWRVRLLEDGTGSLFVWGFTDPHVPVQVDLPEQVDGITVTELSDGCLAGLQDSLVRVTFPETLRSIGAEAFRGCAKLRAVTLPAGVEQIGENAFSGTDIRMFRVDAQNHVFDARDGVLFERESGELAVYPAGSRRKKYMLPSGTKSVASGAFSGNPYLERCALNADLTALPADAFSGTRVRAFETGSDSAVFESVEGVLFRKSINGSAKVLAVYPPGRTQERYIVRRTTRSIDDGAFAGNPYLRHVFLPEGLVRVGNGAFAGCTALEQVSVPDSVLDLGRYAFSGCTSLRRLHLPEELSVLEEGVLEGCTSLEEVELPEETLQIRIR